LVGAPVSGARAGAVGTGLPIGTELHMRTRPFAVVTGLPIGTELHMRTRPSALVGAPVSGARAGAVGHRPTDRDR